MNIPLVSIGMPVYNGSNTLSRALDSLLQQTFTDFEIIISDNASIDNTEEICIKYAANDLRIRYIRQKVNIGAAKNFEYVLNKSTAKYFMWAAADDIRSCNYLKVNYSFLEDNEYYVASTSPVRFENGDYNPISMGDASLVGDIVDRISSYFGCWHANGRFYSLMRTAVLKENPYIKDDYLGSDWAIMLYMISKGKTNRSEKGYIILGQHGFSNSGDILKHYQNRWFHYAIPYAELIGSIIKIIKGFPILRKIYIYALIAKLNLITVRLYWNTKIKQFYQNNT